MDIDESYVRRLFPDMKLPVGEIIRDALQYYKIFTKNVRNQDDKCKIEKILRDEIKTIRHQLFDIPSENKGKVVGSRKRGEIGENLVEGWIRTAFPDAIVTDVSGSIRCGDLKVVLSNMASIMVEVKNYKNTVPSAEITKFKRDLSESDARFGIFVATGRISGIGRHDISIYNEKLIIFIPTATYDAVVWSILSCRELSGIIFNQSTSRDDANIVQKMISLKNELLQSIPMNRRAIANLENTIKKLKLNLDLGNKIISKYIDPIILILEKK